jgi:hypothetical protein
MNIKNTPLAHPENAVVWYKENNQRLRRVLAIILLILALMLIVAMPILMGIQLSEYGKYLAFCHSSQITFNDIIKLQMSNRTSIVRVVSYHKTKTLTFQYINTFSTQSKKISQNTWGSRTIYGVNCTTCAGNQTLAAVQLEGFLRFTVRLPVRNSDSFDRHLKLNNSLTLLRNS